VRRRELLDRAIAARDVDDHHTTGRDLTLDARHGPGQPVTGVASNDYDVDVWEREHLHRAPLSA
jgi:hypothetical protein